MSEKTIFQIKNRDKRYDVIRQLEAGEKVMTQQISGSDVEYFTPDYGFILLEQNDYLNPTTIRGQRIKAVAELSLGPKLALREFYYALRGKPNLVESFKTSSDIYEAVLSSIMDTEIACDVDRANFTVGNLAQGTVFYGHHWQYGDKQKLIGFTEDVARKVLNPWEIRDAMMFIHLEKNSAAGRLHTMGFSELTNSVITTCGGNFTRAVYALTKRFIGDKAMLFFCDGDAYGNDMLRTLEYGSMNSRHMTLDQAFPSSTNSNVYLAGLYPSVCEVLNIPNDVESKRPMSNPQVKQRVEFLERYGLVNQKDLTTWERNKTYELEALSTYFTDSRGNPIGLGIYLVELMRIKNIRCKPAPPEDDNELHALFREEMNTELLEKISTAVELEDPRSAVQKLVSDELTAMIDGIKKNIYENHLDEMKTAVNNSEIAAVRDELELQYQRSPRREKYNMREITDDLVKVDIEIDWALDKLKADIKTALEEYKKNAAKVTDRTEVYEFEPSMETLVPFYDVVERAIGANPADCERIQKALEWRLSDG